MIPQGESEAKWTYSLKTDSFEFAYKGEHYRFLNSISTVSELSEAIHSHNGESLEGLFVGEIDAAKYRPVRVLFNASSDLVMYCAIKINRIDERAVSGTFSAMLLLPRNHSLSNFFLGLFNNDRVGVVLTNGETEIVACNEQFERNVGFSFCELQGRKTSLLKSGKLNSKFYEDMWIEVEKHGFWSGKILTKTKDNSVIPQELTIQSFYMDGDKRFYVGYGRNLKDVPEKISETESGGIELLTQLPNRAQFKKSLAKSVSSLDPQKTMFAIAWKPSIDKHLRFEYVSGVAQVFQGIPKDILGGYLGDNKFMLAFTCDKSMLQNKVHLVKSLITPVLLSIKSGLCRSCVNELQTTHFGVSVLNLDSQSSDQLFSNCITALKERHGNSARGLCFYNPQERAYNQRRENLEKIARHAISNDLVEVFYQPIVDTSSWKVSKVEALCRFRESTGKLLNTQEMVGIIEEIGMAAELDLAVAKQAISDKSKLEAKYGSNVGVSLNVSLRHRTGKLTSLHKLIGLIRNMDCKRANITFEITESAYFDTEARNHDLLKFLNANNIPIAIDDFGTGFSSMSYLRESVFNILKIDKEFVTDLKENSRNFHIIKMIVRLAKILNVKIVAEGVESISDALILCRLGIDMLQGYLFDSPKPIDELKALPKEVYQLKRQISDTEGMQLFSDCVTVLPQSTLEDVRNIFDAGIGDNIPVIYEKRCVGIVNRQLYNLHVPYTLGTPIEKTTDLNSLRKTVSQVMSHQFSVIGSNLGVQSLIKYVSKEIPFPWIVQDDEGEFMGIIEQKAIMRVLVKL
ncbi:EAL domain-containing protein [Vibrio owensii]|uniref:EAL domain-containing protein n=1 Tax=Vibrio owensii TaxID=696485 RepID=UPI003CC52F12